jgi:hypothetical protein
MNDRILQIHYLTGRPERAARLEALTRRSRWQVCSHETLSSLLDTPFEPNRLLLVDQIFSGGTWSDALAALQQERVVVVADVLNLELWEAAKSAGAADVLDAGFDLRELTEVLAVWIAVGGSCQDARPQLALAI